MSQPNTPQDFDTEADNRQDSLVFIIFSLVTCILMLITAVLLGVAV